MSDSMASNNGTLFDSLATEYDEWFESEGKLVFDIEVAAFRELLPELPRPWLEVGVGSGRFARALGIDTGIDPSVKLLEIAEQRGIKTRLARGDDRVFDKEAIGTAFLIVTICFVDSPLAVLQETYRILKPGGKVVLGLVLRESPWGKVYQQKKLEGHRFYEHATFYSYDDIKKLLADSGFYPDKIISTLFQQPGEVTEIEKPENGYYADSGFTIITALKKQN